MDQPAAGQITACSEDQGGAAQDPAGGESAVRVCVQCVGSVCLQCVCVGSVCGQCVCVCSVCVVCDVVCSPAAAQCESGDSEAQRYRPGRHVPLQTPQRVSEQQRPRSQAHQ